MRNLFMILIASATLACSQARAQAPIIYQLPPQANDSLRQLVSEYAKLYKQPPKALHLFSMIADTEIGYRIYLQAYSPTPSDGAVELITSSNRIITLEDSVRIPVIFQADIFSAPIRKLQIEYIPIPPCFVEIKYDGLNWKVASVRHIL